MTREDISPIIVQRALERVRQERVTFDQRRSHESRWFALRLAIGCCSVVLLLAIMAMSSFVLLNNSRFPDAVVNLAGVALFVDLVGVFLAVWRIALSPEFMARLEPVTEIESSALLTALQGVPSEYDASGSEAARTPAVVYRAYVGGVWLAWVSGGEIAGTTGKATRMEALQVRLINAPQELSVRYRAHVQDVGWMGWGADGATAGTVGRGLRLEAVLIVLDNATPGYHIKYQAHVEAEGWMDWRSDGEVAGTTGQSRRMEAIRIHITTP